MAPGRSREPTTVVIGVDELPEPTGNVNARATERARRERAKNTNRRFTFRMVSNVLKCENAIKAFEQAINEQRQEWEEEETERAERVQESVVQEAHRIILI